MIRLLVSLAALLVAGFAAAQTSPSAWYVIQTAEGVRLGHASREAVIRADGREIVATQRLYLFDEGGPATTVVTRTTYREDASGAVRFVQSQSGAGSSLAVTTARIEGGVALLERRTAAGEASSRIVLPEGVRFDEGLALFAGWDPARAPRLEFDNFNIDAMGVEHVTVDAVQVVEGEISAVRRRYERDQLLGVARIRIAPDGRIVETVQPMFGAVIHIVESDRQTAERSHPPFRVVPSLMTRSPFRISSRAGAGHIRFRYAFDEGMEFALPQTGEQRAVSASGFVTLDICAECGPGLASDPATLADALRPTAWLQSDAPQLRAIADPVARLDISDTRKMNMLLERARPFLGRIDFRGHHSALDTLSRRAGDCTEAAVLLAALGRAAGIPTRVASGLVYSRAQYHGVGNVFLPHSWTLAWVDGRWRSFDLALDEFDSTHIALTIGDGDARSIAAAGQLASLLRLESAVEVRREGG